MVWNKYLYILTSTNIYKQNLHGNRKHEGKKMARQSKLIIFRCIMLTGCYQTNDLSLSHPLYSIIGAYDSYIKIYTLRLQSEMAKIVYN